MFKTVLVLVLIPFSILSAAALWQVGYLGIWTGQFANYGTWQVLADLVVAVSLAMYWMWLDAQKTGRNPWPWLLLSLVAGSFGPLLYLVTRKALAEDAPWK
jgi:Terpene cyclase DEP1